jgi:hypothetical protein
VSEATQSMDTAPLAHDARGATFKAAFNPANPLFQGPSALLRLWAGNGLKLFLRYPSSLLRLWADSAPKPLFEYQSLLLRLWADNCELVARNYETGFETFRTATEQQPFGTLLQNSSSSLRETDIRASAQKFAKQRGGASGRDERSVSSNQAQQDNESLIDQTTDLVAKTADRLAETPLAAAIKHAPASRNEAAKARSEVASARRQKKTSRTHTKKAAVQKAASSKKISRKTMKSRTRHK